MLLDAHRDVPPPDQPTKLFVALRPPRQVAEQLYSTARQLCSDVRMAGRQRPIPILHMTVFPIGGGLGRAPRMLLEGIDKAVSSVRFPGIDIVLDQARSFETRQDSVPFVLEGGELTDICALGLATRDALRVKGYSIPARVGYAPHLTVAYSRRRSPRITFEPFGWKARDFQLIESWVDQTKYVQLAEWSLWGDPDEIETTANDGAD